MKLHGFAMSPNTKRARLGLEEAGLEYVFHDVDLMTGAHKKPEYLALNPTGRVPALEHDDFRLWESNAILEYTAELVPEKGLRGTTPRERGEIAQWMFMGAAHLSPNVARIFAHTIRLPEEQRNPRLVEEARAEVDRCLGPTDRHLSGREWLVGERLTIADLSLSPALVYASMLRIDLTKFPGVTSWMGRLKGCASWKKVFE